MDDREGAPFAATDDIVGFERGDPADRARRELAIVRAQYLDAIEQVATPFVATTLRGVIVHANGRAAAALGCASLAKRLLIAFVARGDTRAFRQALAELATRRRDEVAVQLRLRRRGGPVFAALVSGRTVPAAGRGLAGLRWIVEPAETHTCHEARPPQASLGGHAI